MMNKIIGSLGTVLFVGGFMVLAFGSDYLKTKNSTEANYETDYSGTSTYESPNFDYQNEERNSDFSSDYNEGNNNLDSHYEEDYNNRVPSYNGASTNGRSHYVGRNGRVYENKDCGFCSGSGYVQSYDGATGTQVINVCNACEGAGQLSY